MRATDMAYAAGFFDGEGYVSVRRHLKSATTLNLTVRIAQNDRQPLEWLRILFGGNIYSPHANKRAHAYVWVLNGEEAKRFLEVVLPYLMVKKADTEEALAKWNERKIFLS